MSKMKGSFYRPVAVVLFLAFTIISCIPSQGLASIAKYDAESASQLRQVDSERTTNLARVKSVLQAKVVRMKLVELGLTSEEAAERVAALSGEDLARFAGTVDSMDTGSGAGILLLAVVLVAIFALGILSAADKKVVIQ